MRFWILIICFLAFHSSPALAQEKEDKPVTNGYSIGFSKSNRGAGIELNYILKPNQRQYIFSVHLNSVRHLNENNINPAYGRELGRRYVFGKLNYFFVLNPSIGIQKNLFPRGKMNLINFQTGISAGPAIGLLTPYYLEIYSPNQNFPLNNNRSIEPYDPAAHTFGKIFGKANIFSSDINLNPVLGGSLKGWIIMDLARSYRYISAVKMSTHADFFANPVPIMAELDKLQNPRIFVAFSAGFLFGNRW